MAATDLADCTATELLALYRSRQASPVEATSAVLARIDHLNPELRAYSHVAHDDALAAARASEARWMQGAPGGPLDGVPASIKDLILTKGWPTLRGSRTIDAFGIRNQGAKGRAAGVAHPVLFLLDQQGVIRAKLMRDNYKDRPEVDEIIAAASSIK